MVKLGRPRADRATRRERLFTLLDRARERRLAWIHAPAGAGKTTLVTTWIEARQLPCVWYQVGEEDGDVAAFFYHLGLAVRPLALPLFTVENRVGLSGFSRLFFQQLFAGLPAGAVVVFDNVEQGPAGEAWQAALGDGLELVPEGVTVFFLSRGGPFAALSRHRARREVTLLGFDHLRLTGAESEEVVRVVLGEAAPSLPAEAAARVYQLADGWAAGLVLLSEWARKEGHIEAEVLASDAPALFDYFATEVLSRADPETQRFLLATALLPGATAAMAAQLTGVEDAGRILARLHAQSFFTERLPGREPSYRYHPAFRQFLLDRLAAVVDPAALAELEGRAATVLVDAGRSEDALPLLCRGGRFVAAAPLLCAVAPALYAQGRTETLRGWLEQLPEAALAAEPWLWHWRGLCRLVAGGPGALDDLERALAAFAGEGDAEGAYATWAELIGAHAQVFQDLVVLDALLVRFDGLRAAGLPEPEGALEARVVSAHYMAVAARRPGDPGLPALRDRALALASRRSTPVDRVRLASNMLLQDVVTGDEGHAPVVLAALHGVDVDELPAVVRLSWLFARSTHASLGPQPGSAAAIVREGLELARASGVPVFTAELLANGIIGGLLEDDLAGARAALDDLDARIRSGEVAPYGPRVFLHAYVAFAEGDLPVALEQARRAMVELTRLGYGAGPTYAGALLGLVLTATGKWREAGAALAQALVHARAAASQRLEHALLALDADRLLAAGDEAAGLAALRAAMTLGAYNGYAASRLFLPRDVALRLARRALAAGIEVEHARAILAARGLSAPRLEVRTLGRFVVLRDGAPLPPSRKLPRRPLALLKALVAFGERDVPEAVLGQALWPDADGDAAHEALAINLRRLRAVLGDKDAVTRAGNQLSLDPERVWTDARALRRVFAALDDKLPDGDGEALAALAREMLALYRGDFLADEDLGWAVASRERLRAQVVRRAGAVARCFESREAWEQAMACYQGGLEVAELAEPLYLGLVRCQRALGRMAEAAATVERCRRTLAAAGLSLPAELAAAAK